MPLLHSTSRFSGSTRKKVRDVSFVKRSPAVHVSRGRVGGRVRVCS